MLNTENPSKNVKSPSIEDLEENGIAENLVHLRSMHNVPPQYHCWTNPLIPPFVPFNKADGGSLSRRNRTPIEFHTVFGVPGRAALDPPHKGFYTRLHWQLFHVIHCYTSHSGGLHLCGIPHCFLFGGRNVTMLQRRKLQNNRTIWMSTKDAKLLKHHPPHPLHKALSSHWV